MIVALIFSFAHPLRLRTQQRSKFEMGDFGTNVEYIIPSSPEELDKLVEFYYDDFWHKEPLAEGIDLAPAGYRQRFRC